MTSIIELFQQSNCSVCIEFHRPSGFLIRIADVTMSAHKHSEVVYHHYCSYMMVCSVPH